MAEKLFIHHKSKERKVLRRCCAGLLIFSFILLILALIIRAVFQPKKPRFVLQDATVFVLNVSAANVISTTLQITVHCLNPNTKIGVFYDNLEAYVAYNNQKITYSTLIPPVYQGYEEVNVWSPFVYGNMAPYNRIAFAQDQNIGAIKLTVKIDGMVRWMVGSIVSGRYHIHVLCPAYIPVGNSKFTGVKFQLSHSCSVSVSWS